MNELRMTDLERYLAFKKVLERPTFNSIEEAEKDMRAKEGERRRFVVRKPLGVYLICYCFISTDREGNTKWASNSEYSFSHYDLNKYRDRAALAIGRELVECME